MTAPLTLSAHIRALLLAKLDADCETRRAEPLSDHPAARRLEAERQAAWSPR